jgi:hypothetical protein
MTIDVLGLINKNSIQFWLGIKHNQTQVWSNNLLNLNVGIWLGQFIFYPAWLRHFLTNIPLYSNIPHTNRPSEVDLFTQIDLPACRTHHDLIYGSRFPSWEAKVDSTFYYRDYSRVDSEQLVLNVESIDWSTVCMTSSVDEPVTFFSHVIFNLLEQSVPLRRPNLNPWFDIYIYIERAIIDRNLAHRAWISYRTAESWELSGSGLGCIASSDRTSDPIWAGFWIRPCRLKPCGRTLILSVCVIRFAIFVLTVWILFIPLLSMSDVQ